jgi:chromosome segregation ATPase
MRTKHGTASPVSKFRAAMTGFAVVAALAAAGCGSKREHARLVSEKTYLAAEDRRLSDELEARNVETRDLEIALLEVRNGLDEIRGKELAAIRSSIRVAKEGRSSQALREELRAEVRTIRDAVHENLAKLARLEAQSEQAGLKTASLEKLTMELRRSLEEKEALAGELDHRVRDLSATVKTQAASLREKDAALREGEARLAKKTLEANTAYVAVASKRDLLKKGVVERAGGGGRWTRTGKFDAEVFRAIDVTKDLEVEISAPAKSIRVVTMQPRESYRIVDAGPDARTSKLEVRDAEAFWRGDRYLVVMTD